MSEFTFLFGGRDTSASPEQMQKTMEKWVAWMRDLGAKGHIKDQGHPLELTGKVVRGKQKIVNDGPYAEAKDVAFHHAIEEFWLRFALFWTIVFPKTLNRRRAEVQILLHNPEAADG